MSTYVLVYFGDYREPTYDNVCIFDVTAGRFKELYTHKDHPIKDWTKWQITSQTLDSLQEWELESKRGEWYSSTVRVLDVWEE